MTSRQPGPGSIDMAAIAKMTETGYIQRQMVKALECAMVCCDGTVRNSLGDLAAQFACGEDGMDGASAFIEQQTIETCRLNDKEFEHNYHVDVTDLAGGFLPGVLQVGIGGSSLELQAKLGGEYN